MLLFLPEHFRDFQYTEKCLHYCIYILKIVTLLFVFQIVTDLLKKLKSDVMTTNMTILTAKAHTKVKTSIT